MRIFSLFHRIASEDAKGILLMISATFWFSVMTAAVRYLAVDEGVHALQIVFWRSLLAFFFMLPWMLWIKAPLLPTKCMGLYTLRGLNGLIAMMLWFYSLSVVPIATATALGFTAPLFTTLAAILFLNEQVGIRRWTALCVGFIGTLVILRPGVESFDPNYLFVILTSVMWAISNIIIKRLTHSEEPYLIVFYMTIFMAPLALGPALFVWQPISWHQLFWLGVVAVTSNFAQLSISYAYSKTKMSILQPFDFMRLIFTSVIAYFAFSEILDGFTLGGSFIIMSSTVYITYRESVLKKRMAREGCK